MELQILFVLTTSDLKLIVLLLEVQARENSSRCKTQSHISSVNSENDPILPSIHWKVWNDHKWNKPKIVVVLSVYRSVDKLHIL